MSIFQADKDFQIEYSRYLKQVSELLDADESFQEAAKSLTHTNEVSNQSVNRTFILNACYSF